jgi:hypothetical protein
MPKPRQTPFSRLIKGNWKQLAGSAAAATGALALLGTILARRYFNRQPVNQMPGNQEPVVTEPLEKTSAYISIPPAVPYIIV